jgi:energy-coupling factor transport system substrate-specific component
MFSSALARIISAVSISLAGFGSILMFAWPLIINTATAREADLAQAVFVGLMPLMLILILIEVSTGDIGSKQLALLGVLTALNAVIRLLGAGTAGIETAFFIIIISAYVFGSGFGFLLGSASLLVSALLTGGVGPWLPFQMMAAGLVGIGAGLIPKPKAKSLQLALLVCYSIFASFGFGFLMTLWNWPFLAGMESSVSFVPGAGLIENLIRFFQYQILTGGLFWDLGRAITTSVLILITAPSLLATLRRAAGRAGFVTPAKKEGAKQTPERAL